MDKRILSDYIDACELVRETELELEFMEGKRAAVVQDKVSGSMKEFPYISTNFQIEGAVDMKVSEQTKQMYRLILKERRDKAQAVKLQVERWINSVPARMQRIIRYRFFENLSWEEVADKIGRKATGDSLRMEFERFLEKK